MSDPQQPQWPAHPQHQVPPYVSQQQATPHVQAASGYVLNGQSIDPGSSQSRGSNPAGRAGLIIGLIGILIGIVTSVAVQIMIRTDSYMAVGLASGVGSLLSFVAALTAVIFGFIGLRRRGAPLAAAGIAAGIGIAGLIGIATNYLISVLGTLLYF